MPIRFLGLSPAQFEPLFALGDAELEARNIRRMVVDEKPGFPCRVTLEDAEPGESVLLLSYEYQPAQSPYRSSGPIFVREQAQAIFDLIGEVPPVLRERLLSVRCYDANGAMVDADVMEGAALEGALDKFFERPGTTYIHIHFARRGCYACRAERG
jgi:hypothetical protein